MILNPGGRAVYNLPVDVGDEQSFVLIHPARKAGDIYENYCPKGRVEVEVSNNNQSSFVLQIPMTATPNHVLDLSNLFSIIQLQMLN